MIHRHVVHNGKLLPIEQVRLSPGQAGLLNGWGLFTTLRIIDGEPFCFERHWRRLQKDAKLTNIAIPISADAALAQLHELIRANQAGNGCARIYFVSNAGFWSSDEPAPPVDAILYTAPLPEYPEPARLAVREHGRHAASPLAGVKTTAWLNNVWCLQQAQQAGYNEVMLLNERGEVAECTAANIFCVKGGAVLTPPLASGCLEGVTRGLLLELGPQHGVPAYERTLLPGDVWTADEVFISSTNRDLLAISEIQGNAIKSAPGPVTQRLAKIFAAFVAENIASQKRATASR